MSNGSAGSPRMHGLSERPFMILPLNRPPAPERLVAGGSRGIALHVRRSES
jgi:hypothetical protein